jgi:hypothetical protein
MQKNEPLKLLSSLASVKLKLTTSLKAQLVAKRLIEESVGSTVAVIEMIDSIQAEAQHMDTDRAVLITENSELKSCVMWDTQLGEVRSLEDWRQRSDHEPSD